VSGAFTVIADGEIVFSKSVSGVFPSKEEIIGIQRTAGLRVSGPAALINLPGKNTMKYLKK
jgi:hypothetical protein